MSELSLNKNTSFSGRPGPMVLIVMDGIGIGKQDDSNAVYLAKTPTLDALFGAKLYTQLQAHGKAVGLPSDDDMGNSEIGHNALGAGRVFDQGAKLVNRAIETESMYDGEVWKSAIAQALAGGTLHFIGLHSDGNVHSNTAHLYAMLRRAAKEGVKRCRVHILHDGRDVPEKSALVYIDATERVLGDINQEFGADFRIASGGGRMITTMDRYEADWRIVERGWKAHVLGEARAFSSAKEAVETMYAESDGAVDQYLDSFVVVENGRPVGTIEDGDAVVFFNFRGDRAIEISQAFEGGSEFNKFDRVRVPSVYYAGIMQYDGDLKLPKHFLVSPPVIDRTFCEYLCAEKVSMFAISETQKFGHVTYFWNGNRSGYINPQCEDYEEIPSDRIEFDKAPLMKAEEITAWVEKALASGKFRFGRLNLANGDMVGHTGNMEATIKAVEKVDECVGRILSVIQKLNGIAIVTADHGNADEMWTEKKGVRSPRTAHTLNPVPFCIFDPMYAGEYEMAVVPNPGLANVAATVLNLLGFEAPADYCPSLVRFTTAERTA
ncbi:MAG: 2,3-bisphosphoglycerate-independent phosphoglycerate mutase [Planctomycetia bacterium]|nr:2,3-bisphosphoglycerate-independent phosphoglycerate mutase [Planctomycetia bacterium]